MQKRFKSFCADPDNHLNTDIHIHFTFNFPDCIILSSTLQFPFHFLRVPTPVQCSTLSAYSIRCSSSMSQSICGCNSTLGRGRGVGLHLSAILFQEQTHKCKSGASNEREQSGLGIRYILERIQAFSIESLCKTAKRQVYRSEST